VNIPERLLQVEEKIDRALRRAGRNRNEIKLMAVTKNHPLETVEAAWKAGLKLFGESKVQEAMAKFPEFLENHSKDGAVLHLIGSLQRNKAKNAAAFFNCIQSIDRDSLINELGSLTCNRENPLMILLEFHTGEETKAGFSDLDSLFRAAEKVLSFKGLCPEGLMTMAPYTTDTDAIRSSFRKLASARGELEKRFPGYWHCLSMGMSNDFDIAIEEGSTLIRIGTALFGERVHD